MSLMPSTAVMYGGVPIDPMTGLPKMQPPTAQQQPSFIDRVGGLLGGGQSYGGLLSPEDEKAARNRALMAMGASLLASSGPSPVRVGTGQALGQAMMAGMGAKDQANQSTLQSLLLKSQIEKAKQKDRGKLVPVIGADGKPTYRYEADAEGMSPYEKPQGDVASASSLQEYEAAKATGFIGSYIDFVREQAKARYVAPPPPQEPLIAVQTPDGRSMLVPRSQAVGQSPAAPREGALPTEGERTAGNYLGRMEAAEQLLGDYDPAFKDYVAATAMMSRGPMAGSLANMAISPEGQKYYQAAADWVRAKLRKESGAVISPAEMEQEIKTYFPMPGDSASTRNQKQQARQQAMAGMRQMSGRAAPKTAPQTSGDDPLGLFAK